MRRRTRILALIAALASLAGTAGAASAQQMTVSATIPLPAPTGGGVRNLSFGTIGLTGTVQNVSVPPAIAPQSATVYSGEFEGTVGQMSGIHIQLSMPTQLSAGPGIPPLVFSAAGNYAGFCTIDGGTGCTALTLFDPVLNPTQWICKNQLGNGNCQKSRSFGAGAVYRVYVGGQLTVPPTAAAATYNGIVTLTVVGQL
jgi:spore coat protein U-like protein